MEEAPYALFPCPGMRVVPSARVTGSKGLPLAKMAFPLHRRTKEGMNQPTNRRASRRAGEQAVDRCNAERTNRDLAIIRSTDQASKKASKQEVKDERRYTHSVHSYACAAVHSALEVGLLSANTSSGGEPGRGAALRARMRAEGAVRSTKTQLGVVRSSKWSNGSNQVRFVVS